VRRLTISNSRLCCANRRRRSRLPGRSETAAEAEKQNTARCRAAFVGMVVHAPLQCIAVVNVRTTRIYSVSRNVLLASSVGRTNTRSLSLSALQSFLQHTRKKEIALTARTQSPARAAKICRLEIDFDAFERNCRSEYNVRFHASVLRRQSETL